MVSVETMDTVKVKLVAAKLELQKKISHWRQEWKDAIDQWSEKIVVGKAGGGFDCILLPSHDDIGYPLVKNLTCDLGFAVCYVQQYAHCYLEKVPINLSVNVFHHFLVAFGGELLLREPISDKLFFDHWLWIDEENKRHHKIIHDSLLFGEKEVDACDRWERVKMKGFQLGGKLLPIHYIEGLLQKRKSFQINQMIEHYFRHRNDGERGSRIIETAKRFQKLLIYQNLGEVFVIVGSGYLRLLNEIPGTENRNVKDEREAVKTFELGNEDNGCRTRGHWNSLLKYPDFVALLGDSDCDSDSDSDCRKLTVEDVRFLICSSIDAEYDYRETLGIVQSLSKVEDSLNLSNLSTSTTTVVTAVAKRQFPSADDDFSSFDPLHLRGLLAETVLSKKLQGYALGQEEIRGGAFATIAPLALTKIVSSYYPVDLLNA